MKILLTGASSYVGAKIYTDLKNEFDVIGTYNSNKLFDELRQLDITNQEDVSKLIDEIKPNWIIHVAANANAGLCEKNPEEAVEINQKGTEYIVEAANKIGARIIFISSYAAINHKSVYAKTKLEGEEIVKRTSAGYVVLRPAHIVGYSPNTKNDRQFNRFLRNLLDGVPAIYDTSWKFQPTYLKHISEVIQVILKKGIMNETIPIAVPELKSRFDLARDILTPFNINVDSEDRKDDTPSFNEDLSKLKELNLPEYTYSEMIKEILSEIRQYFDV